MSVKHKHDPETMKEVKLPWWVPEFRDKGHVNEKGQYTRASVDKTLEPVVHMRSNPREYTKAFDVGEAEDRIPWPDHLPKGKVFLVNDTFIRVDGVNYVNLRSFVGKYNMIEVNTGIGKSAIATPKCEGYVLAPLPRWLQTGIRDPLGRRCMTQAEVREAEQDHVFLRMVDHPIATNDNPNKLWIEYYHATNDWGESYARHRLLAFNRVLHKKREEENARRHAAGIPYDYADLMNSTFDPKKHSMKQDNPFERENKKEFADK